MIKHSSLAMGLALTGLATVALAQGAPATSVATTAPACTAATATPAPLASGTLPTAMMTIPVIDGAAPKDAASLPATCESQAAATQMAVKTRSNIQNNRTAAPACTGACPAPAEATVVKSKSNVTDN